MVVGKSFTITKYVYTLTFIRQDCEAKFYLILILTFRYSFLCSHDSTHRHPQSIRTTAKQMLNVRHHIWMETRRQVPGTV